jgi:hypothetical protein
MRTASLTSQRGRMDSRMLRASDGSRVPLMASLRTFLMTSLTRYLDNMQGGPSTLAKQIRDGGYLRMQVTSDDL